MDPREKKRQKTKKQKNRKTEKAKKKKTKTSIRKKERRKIQTYPPHYILDERQKNWKKQKTQATKAT